MAARDYGQYDGVTRAMELIGERWALLIVRDLLVGPRRYGELAAGLPRIPTNVLASRLRELQTAGVLQRMPRSRVIVYELTDFGRELEPLVLALGGWGLRALGTPRDDQIITPDAMTVDLRAAFRPEVAATLPRTRYAGTFGSVDLLIAVDGAALVVERGLGDADLSFAAPRGIRDLLVGAADPVTAVRSGALTVRAGAPELVDRFARTFRIAA